MLYLLLVSNLNFQSKCKLQRRLAPSMKRPVEIGKLKNGLYKLLQTSHAAATTLHHSSSSNIDFICHSNYVVPCDSHASSSTCYSTPTVSSFPDISCTNSSDMNKMEIFWHNRLGHMPFVRMKDTPHILCQFSSKQPLICSISLMAKQTRLVFPDSSVKSNHPFQFIYVDTWGPYNSPLGQLGPTLWVPKAMPSL
ncbi:uncharacterized protein LOC132613558 [Lycium barbarum]|uniref:uncharacterized protein LOC132613558 n=1 Tax=Lycium barbarum TaxID=112863 RepID=UPI00293F3018|nr:uncharacterized protein LOC132613558 [Lycium barbarum]